VEVATFDKIHCHFSPIIPPSAAGFVNVASDAGGLLWRKLERSKSLVLLQIGGLMYRWQRLSVKPSCWECSTTVEQAETQLRVVVPIEEEEEETSSSRLCWYQNVWNSVHRILTHFTSLEFQCFIITHLPVRREREGVTCDRALSPKRTSILPFQRGRPTSQNPLTWWRFRWLRDRLFRRPCPVRWLWNVIRLRIFKFFVFFMAPCSFLGDNHFRLSRHNPKDHNLKFHFRKF
jgi:hypothetical protein